MVGVFVGNGVWSLSDGQQRKQHLQNGQQEETPLIQNRQNSKGNFYL